MMKKDDLKALAKSRRQQTLADLKDGRKRVAKRIESGKLYNRKRKYVSDEEQE
jgi:hypothetical protein